MGAWESVAPEGEEEATRWERAWRERSWATSSELSFAALTARVVGMMRREAAKAPMASCSREPCFNKIVSLGLNKGWKVREEWNCLQLKWPILRDRCAGQSLRHHHRVQSFHSPVCA